MASQEGIIKKNVFLFRPSAGQCVRAKEDEVLEGADGRQGGGISIHRDLISDGSPSKSSILMTPAKLLVQF